MAMTSVPTIGVAPSARWAKRTSWVRESSGPELRKDINPPGPPRLGSSGGPQRVDGVGNQAANDLGLGRDESSA